MSWISEWLGQDAAKQSGKLTDKAIGTATDIYGSEAPYRAAALTDLTSPQSAAQLAAMYGPNPTYQPINDPLLTAARSGEAKALADLTTSPDYLAQAKTALTDFQAQAAPQLDAALRKVGQKAGAQGRVGAQGVTTEMGTLGADFARTLQSEEDALISSALDKTQQAKLADLGAISGIEGQTYGEGANDRATKLALGEEGVQNTLAERGQTTARGLSLADLGYSNSPVGAYQSGAKTYSDQSAADAASFANLVKALGGIAAGGLGGASPGIARAG